MVKDSQVCYGALNRTQFQLPLTETSHLVHPNRSHCQNPCTVSDLKGNHGNHQEADLFGEPLGCIQATPLLNWQSSAIRPRKNSCLGALFNAYQRKNSQYVCVSLHMGTCIRTIFPEHPEMPTLDNFFIYGMYNLEKYTHTGDFS